MPVKVVLLTLSILNSESGATLHQEVQQMPEFSMSGSHIEDCRQLGIRIAKKLVVQYRVKYPYAFANVDCEWSSRPYESL